MTFKQTFLATATSLLVLSGSALAADAPAVPAAPAEALPANAAASEAKPHHGQRMTPEEAQALLDGHIAMIKTALRLTPDQDKLWAPVEQVMRDESALQQRNKAEAREQHQAHGKFDPVARLEMESKRATERAAYVQKLADALKPLYATFTDEQKSVAALIIKPQGGKGHGHGAMHG